MRLHENQTDGYPLTELLLDAPSEATVPARPAPRLDGVVIGRFQGFDAAGAPLVDFLGNPTSEPLAARATATLTEADRGREVALLFENGDPLRPVVLGLIQSAAVPAAPAGLRVEADGERLVLTANKEVVLKCGQASITLTRAGKVLIRGAYLLSRSSGANRIKGGSVQIN